MRALTGLSFVPHPNPNYSELCVERLPIERCKLAVEVTGSDTMIFADEVASQSEPHTYATTVHVYFYLRF